MRIGGTLSKWNDDRGFGFIKPARGGPDVFVHISEFPEDGKPPRIGEKLTFELETDDKGKARAVRLLCPQRPVVEQVRPYSPRKQAARSGPFRWLVPLVLVFLGIYGFSEYRHQLATPTTIALSAPESSRHGESGHTDDLPAEAQETLRLIKQNGPFPYERDGTTFGNYEHLLPEGPRGYYREYTVPTPGAHDRGARRIVCGQQQDCYYTPDHYRHFRRIHP